MERPVGEKMAPRAENSKLARELFRYWMTVTGSQCRVGVVAVKILPDQSGGAGIEQTADRAPQQLSLRRSGMSRLRQSGMTCYG